MTKKLMALSIALAFLVLAVPVSPGSSSPSTSQHTVTFTKYLPDGDIEHISETITVQNGYTFSQSISQRCVSLLYEDTRFQTLINQETGLYLIVSAGDGLHFALPPALFEIRLLRISFNLIPSLIYCSYSDEEASTDLTPMGGTGEITSLAGPHKVLAGGFVGIIGWNGVFSFSSAGFAGLTLYAWTSDT